jgi:hypothetical protein
MNYQRIRLILAIYKAFYINCPQTSTQITHYNIILKHARVLRRLTNCLIDISLDLTSEEKTTIEQDYIEVLIAIYGHFRRPYQCRLIYT